MIGSLGVVGNLIGAAALLADDLHRAANNTNVLITMSIGLFFLFLGTCLSILVIAGGASMARLRRRRLSLVAAYVVTGLSLAGSCAILFFPFGIWALVVLYRPDVRREFHGRPVQSQHDD